MRNACINSLINLGKNDERIILISIDQPTSFEKEFKEMNIPVLLVIGDEDELCLEVNLFLKRQISTAGLWICPRTGHAINLEEPAAFNAAVQSFLSSVERGHWGQRDERSDPSHGTNLGLTNE